MELNYNTEKAFFEDLESVLSRACSVADVRRLHDHFFYTIEKSTPPKKQRRKAEMVQALLALQKTPEQLQKFVDTLPSRAKTFYAALMWNESADYTTLLNKLDFEFVRRVEERGWGVTADRYYIEDDFPLAAMRVPPSDYSYRSYRNSNEIRNYEFLMPPAVRSWLRPYFPKPQGYDIEAVSEAALNEQKLQHFDASAAVVNELNQLADFLKRSELKTTKAGRYTKSSLQKASALTAGAEWYVDSKALRELALMRHEILLDFINGFEGKLLANLIEGQLDGSTFKNLLQEIIADEEILNKWLLGHLKARYKYFELKFDPKSIHRLFDLYRLLPVNAWVRVDNLKSLQFYREIDICFFDPGRYCFRTAYGEAPYIYEQDIELYGRHLQAAGIDPLINGSAFILAAFGLLELRYTEPNHPRYHTKKRPYLSPWDGAVAMKLTPIGAFVFGQSKQLKLETTQRQRTQLNLRSDRLFLNAQEVDPVTQLALDDFFEKISPGFYRLTRKSLLKGCQSTKDVKARVADLKQRLPTEFPDNWKAFFHKLGQEQSVLQRDFTLAVYSLADRPDLRHDFLNDPILQRYTLKVEGHRVAVDTQHLRTVNAQLRKLGYLVEN
ncbi:MAG: hypothetical protein ACNA77_09320 [Opitutales bacterium]